MHHKHDNFDFKDIIEFEMVGVTYINLTFIIEYYKWNDPNSYPVTILEIWKNIIQRKVYSTKYY
jgi:hypothetical protein